MRQLEVRIQILLRVADPVQLKTRFKYFGDLNIFEKFNIDEETYRKSFSHYFFEPKELDEIYESVIDSLLLYQQIK